MSPFEQDRLFRQTKDYFCNDPIPIAIDMLSKLHLFSFRSIYWYILNLLRGANVKLPKKLIAQTVLEITQFPWRDGHDCAIDKTIESRLLEYGMVSFLAIKEMIKASNIEDIDYIMNATIKKGKNFHIPIPGTLTRLSCIFKIEKLQNTISESTPKIFNDSLTKGSLDTLMDYLKDDKNKDKRFFINGTFHALNDTRVLSLLNCLPIQEIPKSLQPLIHSEKKKTRGYLRWR